ncbi:sensor histidine kinase [uncultured Subdoligranulum sp.]|uniref:sensor histidine kinase n=1 Tax=uncultured Subdoligranulum sp. TaxID=512298 RepID=UPI0025D3D7E5|nr:HAMP domain-containing sensor histidine kinase [uncultured Subdoligranulum sp.]
MVHIVHKQLDDGIFLGGEDDLLSVFVKAEGAGIVLEGTGGDHLVRPGQAAPAAADEGFCLGRQGDGVEGLGDVVIRPCLDADGTIYLSFVKETESRLQYAVLVELTAFYDTVAGNLIAGTQDRILLLDAGGRTVVYQTAEGVTAERIGSDAQAAIQQEELDALLGCRDGGEPMTLFYQARAAGGAKAYTARMAALPAEGNNGVFVVGASLNFETIKRPIQMSTIRLTAYSSMIVVGILLLAGSIVLATRRSARAQQEVLTLREQNQALEEVTKKTQALAHHQRLEIIGTLTSSIAHEFNNLLTPIMGYSIMVLEKLPPEDEETCDNVLEIYEASRKAKTIISRLSDLSRKNTALTFQYLSPDDLAQRALDIAAPARPPKVQVQSRLQCRHLWLYGNEIQLSQMLLNLILNAYQAMEAEGGTLTVTTGAEGDEICFRIADTGPGIDPAVRKDIFEPFFTTKERGKGTGLGLAIVQQVAQEHHGKVCVDSEPGRGTTMTVRLPMPAREDEPEPDSL